MTTTMTMIKKTTAVLISLTCCALVAGCTHPLGWFDDQPSAKKSAAVLFKATDASTASMAALNKFPTVPHSVSDMNNFPVVPLNWRIEGEQDDDAEAQMVANIVPIAPLEASQSASPGISRLTHNTRYHPMIKRVSNEVGIDADLLHAMIKVESNYQPQAVSHKGARGLLQVMPATGKRFGVTNLMDPEHNLRAGATYMKWLIEHFDNDLTLALAGYNAGEGAVKKYGRAVPPYKETQHYVKKVLGHYNRLQNSKSEQEEVLSSEATPVSEIAANKKTRNTQSENKADKSDIALGDKLLGLLLSQPKATTTANKKHGTSVNEHAVL
ncbi:lytic transglycosylase domain-containing protein [Rouxiella badensis]|jgi:soluble lytic murein transglycosylase-like protein|uniref:lytic transglycosylase domain-containing protein n=1 Tax=Rouxiella badensis TaxID=1646377 RepID=UPI0028D06166|nr:lytic transglycosylase domain-containing protein [Rouxiella badensis]